MGVDTGLTLLCRIGSRRVALPLASVVETMRPGRIERITGAPAFVLGLAIIRGKSVPVVDTAHLLTGSSAPVSRFVVLRVGERHVALAVSRVDGMQALEARSAEALPPLLASCNADLIAAVGTLDAELLLVLGAARIVPEEVFAQADARARAS